MAKKKRIVGFEGPIMHAGHEIYAQYKEIDGYNVELIQDFSSQRNHAQARISALHNSLHKLTIDGKEINLEISESGGTSVPAYWDSDKRKFLKDVLLEPLVNKYATFLADACPDTFEKFLYDEEPGDQAFPTHSTPTGDSQSLRVAGDE